MVEKLKSLSSHTKAIVEKVFADKGFTLEETALLYYWPRIVGQAYAEKFSPLKITTLETTLNPALKQLHVRTKAQINPVEAGYDLVQLKTRICEYFGFEVIQEIKVRKGK